MVVLHSEISISNKLSTFTWSPAIVWQSKYITIMQIIDYPVQIK